MLLILSCFFLFFLAIDWYFLTPSVIPQICDPTVEHVVSIRVPTKEPKGKIETDPAAVEANISKCWTKFKAASTFCLSYQLNHFSLFLQWNNFLFYLDIPI